MSVRSRDYGLGRSGGIAIALLMLVASALSQAPDRSRPPQPGPPRELKLPPIQHDTLSNGLPVLLLEKHQVPLVQVDLVVRAGAVDDPRGKAGRASMTADLLTQGAGLRNALQFADAVDLLGARLDAESGMHTLGVDLFVPLARLDSALNLMSDVVLRPTFPQSELDRQVKDRLTALIQWRDEPEQLASVMLNRILFHDDHPYGVPPMGDEKSIRGLTVDDVRGFYREYFHPNNAVLIVVGDVTKEMIMPRLEKAFGAWRKGLTRATQLGRPEQVRERTVTIIDKPGAAQSEIYIGRIGVPRKTDDFYAIVVMNTILGGSFTSRLNNNIREVHGYAYGAYSWFDFRVLPGPFVAEAAVQTAVTDRALTEFMKELANIRTAVSDAEVERARNYVALSFPSEFQTVGGIAGRIAQLVAFGLPDDTFGQFIGRILAVSRNDVERAARTYIDPDRVAIVICGDRSKIEEGVRALNLGPVTVMTADDVFGKSPDIGTQGGS